MPSVCKAGFLQLVVPKAKLREPSAFHWKKKKEALSTVLLPTAVKPYLFIHTETMRGIVDAPSRFCTARSSAQRWCTTLRVG